MNEQAITLRQFNSSADDLFQEWRDWYEEFDVFVELKQASSQREKFLYLQNKGGSDLIRLIKTLPAHKDEITIEQLREEEIAKAGQDENAVAAAKGKEFVLPVFDNAVKKLNYYFGLKRNPILTQHKFRLLRQSVAPKEKFGAFMARLYKQAANCNWTKDETENQIIQQIATGAREMSIRRKAVTSGMNLSQLEQWANVQELAEEQLGWLNAENRPETETLTSSDTVAQVHGKGAQKVDFRSPKRFSPYTSGKNYIKDCLKCGRNHQARNCPAMGKVCNFCKKLNHFEAKCFAKNPKETRKGKKLFAVRGEEDSYDYPVADDMPGKV